MAGGGGGRTLEETPTWAVAVVCVVLVTISCIIEHIIHLIGKWLTKKNKKTLFEALERVKSELMLLGFISLLMTVGTVPITEFCVSKAIGNTWLPCDKESLQQEYSYKYRGEIDVSDSSDSTDNGQQRRLLSFIPSDQSQRRSLAVASASYGKCESQGKVPFLSADGLHQLHLFIFALAVFHVLCSMITLGFGRAKMGEWKAWEMETQTAEYQYSHDPERFRFARDTSFGRRHLSFWSRSPILLWMVSFVRQFVRSVPKVDYMTLRHGFIMAHLAPNSQVNFDFQKYINRSLEEDFKVVVGISPPIWFLAVLFLLFNTNGWRSYLWLPFIPLMIILLVGTKLQVIITKMGLMIQERGEVVKGTPVVQPTDDLFWFKRPGLLLYLIHFVLFQNAFQLAFFAWSWMEFGAKSCFHARREDFIIRISMGVIVQILCSYVTLPLYALVTQMGSSMKPTIFNDRVVKALHSWRQNAKRNVKQNNRQSNSVTPMSSRPTTPLHNASPNHLLHYYKDEAADYTATSSPQVLYFHNTLFEAEGRVNSLPQDVGQPGEEREGPAPQADHPSALQHEIDIQATDDQFSFEKSTRM